MSRQIYRIYRSTRLILRNIFDALPFDRPFLLPHQKPYRPYLSCHSRSCWNARRWRVISSPTLPIITLEKLILLSLRYAKRHEYEITIFIVCLSRDYFQLFKWPFNLKRSMKEEKRKKERKNDKKKIKGKKNKNHFKVFSRTNAKVDVKFLPDKIPWLITLIIL